MTLAARLWASRATWVVPSAQAGCNCPAATASPPARAPQGGGTAGCASGRRGDAGQPWKRESFVSWGGQVGGGPGEAAAVRRVWAGSE